MRSIPGVHLSKEGVALARRIGQEIGPFERVVTSTLPRAFETAIAMGFAVDEQVELMSTYGDAVEQEVPWPQSFAAYAKAVKRDKAASRYAQQLAKYYSDLAASIADCQAALVINHGGIVELGVVAAFPDADYESWGDSVSYCEGARLSWQDGKCIYAELLRVRS
jgi:broad specificity phosphatase PhoE